MHLSLVTSKASNSKMRLTPECQISKKRKKKEMSFCQYKINLTRFDVLTLMWSELHTMPKCGSSIIPHAAWSDPALHCEEQDTET